MNKTTHGSGRNKMSMNVRNVLQGVARATVIIAGCLFLAGCDDIPSPDAFAFVAASPTVINKDGLLVRLQKYSDTLDNELQFGKDFYTQNNSYLLEVINESTNTIRLIPYVDAFIEDAFGKKYTSTTYIGMDTFSSDSMVPGLLGGAIGGGFAAGFKQADMLKKLFWDTELAPGETKKGLILFEKLTAGEYSIKVVLPKMIEGADASDRTFLWRYDVTLKEKK